MYNQTQCHVWLQTHPNKYSGHADAKPVTNDCSSVVTCQPTTTNLSKHPRFVIAWKSCGKYFGLFLVFSWMYPHAQNSYTREVFHSLGACKRPGAYFYPMVPKQQIFTILYTVFLDRPGELLCCLVFTRHTLPLPSFLPHPGTLAFGLFVKRYTSLTLQGMKLRNRRSAPHPIPPSPHPVGLAWLAIGRGSWWGDGGRGWGGVRELNVMVS